MRIKQTIITSILVVLLLLGPPLLSGAAKRARQPVRIGVLAYRGADIAVKMWGPTADYLSRTIPSCSFSIVPLGFHEINAVVGRGDVDFVLANSSIYVELEALYGTNRIATMQNL